MGCSREGTKQERIVDSIVQSARNLDKTTWVWYDKVYLYGSDLIEEAEFLRNKVNEYIDEIKNQMSKKSLGANLK
jgi:hypothetical protein